MTTPSHTELAARNLWETIKILGLQNEKLALQAIAAALESPERVQGEATDWKRCEACNGKGDSASGRTACGGCRGSGRVAATPPTAPAQDVHAQRNAQTLVDIGNAALRAGWNGVDMKAFVFARLATPSPQAEKQPLSDDWIRSMCKQGWVFDTVKQWVRVTEAAHGIVTKEST